MTLKQWKQNEISTEKSRILSEEYGLSTFVTDILVGRGLDSPLSAEEFLTEVGSYSDPFELPDMEAAANRIIQAVEQGEKIAVYGDYDCDGVTATVILYQYLESMGADVLSYIPERESEGYGLNPTAVQKLAEQGVSLLVTVDNGISAVSEVELANRLGMEVVITDHHQPGEVLPNAVAVVDPHRRDWTCSFRSYCGAGVALMLVAALEDGSVESAVEYFGDIAAIGTIGDIVPLIGENRLLVKQGLRLIQNSENFGLRALIDVSGLSGRQLTAENVAFGLSPRINAAGRMGSAGLALDLLLCEDEETASEKAEQINRLNAERQQQEASIMKEIEADLALHPEKLKERVLVLAGENWPHGVIGIVSARILERFSKPNVLLSCNGEDAVGSARSCGDFHLFKALSACSSLLIKYGGHKQAAGLSLKTSDIEAFSSVLNQYAKEISDEMPQVAYQIDREIYPNEITVENVDQLSILQPFGSENQQPLFLVKNLNIKEIKPLSENKHLKINFADSKNQQVQALYFGMRPEHFSYDVGDTVDILCYLDINEYNGRRSVSVKIKDIRFSNFEESKFFHAKSAYEKICRGEKIAPSLKPRIVPTREEIAVIYRLLHKNQGFPYDIEQLYLKIIGIKLNYCKLRLILDILNEMKLIILDPLGAGITLPEQTTRVDLKNSVILKQLYNL